MLRDGKYAAWFRTPRGQGTGLVDLTEGRISGRDGFFTYGGSYQVEQQRFTAVLTVKRHAEGNPSVFVLCLRFGLTIPRALLTAVNNCFAAQPGGSRVCIMEESYVIAWPKRAS